MYPPNQYAQNNQVIKYNIVLLEYEIYFGANQFSHPNCEICELQKESTLGQKRLLATIKSGVSYTTILGSIIQIRIKFNIKTSYILPNKELMTTIVLLLVILLSKTIEMFNLVSGNHP